MNALDIRPMLATAGRPPVRYTDFAIEAKYDGQRGLAIIDSGAVTLLSRNGANITRTFPEITAALPRALAGRSVVLDGEIVAPDECGVPRFGRLQVERRCTVAHELVHDERRVFPTDPVMQAREETLVEQTAARRLIELPDLVDALRACSTRCAETLADHCWVD
ncbi:hypothetical protein C6A85_99665 [Mycobacterium sp. ITM-2017-0098]|nr:hypothetical protein C6A85_99665 [Mycobacterium sp. ITM-2017-0098]